jgi:TetR/AcrR family transcriptional repressor of lmrAB and yxaGH operons
MTSNAKQQMIEGAVRLLATKGLQATSFSEVLELTGAPRGSIYYHFPGGKDQLVAAAIELAGARTLAAIETKRGSSALEITDFFIDQWRQLLVRANFRAGCSIVAVTVATDSSVLRDQAAAIFDAWQDKLTSLFIDGGVESIQARNFAILLINACEGAVVVARAQKSIDAFELTTFELRRQAERL